MQNDRVRTLLEEAEGRLGMSLSAVIIPALSRVLRGDIERPTWLETPDRWSPLQDWYDRRGVAAGAGVRILAGVLIGEIDGDAYGLVTAPATGVCGPMVWRIDHETRSAEELGGLGELLGDIAAEPQIGPALPPVPVAPYVAAYAAPMPDEAPLLRVGRRVVHELCDTGALLVNESWDDERGAHLVAMLVDDATDIDALVARLAAQLIDDDGVEDLLATDEELASCLGRAYSTEANAS